MQSGINRADKAGVQIAAKGVEDDNLAKNLIELRQGELYVKAAAHIVKTGDESAGHDYRYPGVGNRRQHQAIKHKPRN